MANIKSAEKRILVAERNRVRNRAVRTQLRNQVKKFRAAIEAADAAGAAALLRQTQATLDRSTRKGVIHARTASRTMSRLAAAHAGLVGSTAR